MRRGLSPRKAKKILKDGSVRGNPLTPPQQRFMGAVASGQPIMGDADRNNIRDLLKRKPKRRTA